MQSLPIIVQKYGGSSVATTARIKEVASLIKERRDEGFRICVVVSAMGKTTDQLLSLANELSKSPSRRELDMLLSCGERASMALLAMALHELDVPSISFTGSQSGIITDDVHSGAKIIEVRPSRVQDELDLGKVVIVAGFQGVSYKREITTLGRGGSDTTAVALAAALHAVACEIYSDVAGVYSADPRVVPDAQLLECISFDEMQELASSGAKVLNSQAVSFAKKRGITIYARKTGEERLQTIIGEAEVRKYRNLSAIAHQEWVYRLSIKHPTNLPAFLEHLVQAGIAPSLVSLGGDEPQQAWCLVPPEDAHGLDQTIKELPFNVVADTQCGTVSVVGQGLAGVPATLAQALNALDSKGVAVEGIVMSSLRATLVVPRASVYEVARLLHDHLFSAESA